MSHRYHPDIEAGDSEDAILFDDCEDCAHKAELPVQLLDHERIERLWNRMLAVELDEEEAYRSVNERNACMNLWDTYIFLERHTFIDPQSLAFKA